jgi:hypothetical protein
MELGGTPSLSRAAEPSFAPFLFEDYPSERYSS